MDVKRLLKKKAWTGAEAGKAIILALADDYKRTFPGEENTPILIPREKIRAMVAGLAGNENELKTYNAYVNLHNWIRQYQAIANAHYQAFQGNLNELINIHKAADLAENEYRQAESIPRIMTQKQYDDLRKKRVEELINPERKEVKECVYTLITRLTEYFFTKLKNNPKAANPLNAIKKLYKTTKVENPVLLAAYFDRHMKTSYQLPDGTRKDQVSLRDWKNSKIRTIPIFDRLYAEMKNIMQDDENDLYDDIYARALHLGFEIDGVVEGVSMPVDIPAPSKWDFIKDRSLLEYSFFQCVDISDSNEEQFWGEAAKTFKKEFPELAEVVLQELDKTGCNVDGQPISAIPTEKWGNASFSWRELYDDNFPGFKEWLEDDYFIFQGDRRAFINGIAILRPASFLHESATIDERGYYKGQTDCNVFSIAYGLEAYTDAVKGNSIRIRHAAETRDSLELHLRWILGYNAAVEIISKEIGLPEFLLFNIDEGNSLRYTKLVNTLFDRLYQSIYETEYFDKEGKEEKLKVLRDVFQPFKTDSLIPSGKAKRKAASLLKGLAAFAVDRDNPSPELEFMAVLTTPDGGKSL